jgi:hypothetical protein
MPTLVEELNCAKVHHTIYIWITVTLWELSPYRSRANVSGFRVMTRTPCHSAHWWLVRISQVASSTPFLCCSRFSPIAFNLSNTKSSIQLLFVPDCPFRRLSPFDRIQRDRPYTTSDLYLLSIHIIQNMQTLTLCLFRIPLKLMWSKKMIWTLKVLNEAKRSIKPTLIWMSSLNSSNKNWDDHKEAEAIIHTENLAARAKH